MKLKSQPSSLKSSSPPSPLVERVRVRKKQKQMNSISPLDLQVKINNLEDILLIDVREEFEHNDFNIGGTLIPMNTVFENIDAIPKDKPVVLYCAKGIRSAMVIQRLEEKFGYTNLINLSGGMYGWRNFFSI
jgi:rhodanese-related sulfurtransferase